MNVSTTRVLVSAGSKHGATAEIADRIGRTLGNRGFEVTVSRPDEVDDVSGYDAVILGSAVYAGHWVASAKELAELVAAASPPIPTWLFSSGPVGDPPKPDETPVDVAAVAGATSARDHRVFSGKIDKSKLSFGEKAILVAVRAPEGDFRDWDEIEAWAEEIAEKLASE
jgi:menaquinone-dependent protoporphyrinogen oxidase